MRARALTMPVITKTESKTYPDQPRAAGDGRVSKWPAKCDHYEGKDTATAK